MPRTPARACAQPGCSAVVRGTRYCGTHAPAHRRQYDDHRGSSTQRGYGVTWRRLRVMFLAAHPLCADPHNLHGATVVAATDVDHIVPKARGGKDEWDNLQALCHSCHTVKTNQEARMTPAYQRSTIPVTIVAGPPGAGKTRLVKDRAQWGDLIVDLDAIHSAISGLDWYEKPAGLLPFALACRDALLRKLAESSDVRHAWIITSEADPLRLARLQSQLGAELVVLDVDANECIRRISQDERRKDKWELWVDIVRRWHREYRGGGGSAISVDLA